MNDESKNFNIMLPEPFFKRSHHTFDTFNFSLNNSPFPFKKPKQTKLNLQPTKVRYILRCVFLLTLLKYLLTFIRDVYGSTLSFSSRGQVH